MQTEVITFENFHKSRKKNQISKMEEWSLEYMYMVQYYITIKLMF